MLMIALPVHALIPQPSAMNLIKLIVPERITYSLFGSRAYLNDSETQGSDWDYLFVDGEKYRVLEKLKNCDIDYEENKLGAIKFTLIMGNTSITYNFCFVSSKYYNAWVQATGVMKVVFSSTKAAHFSTVIAKKTRVKMFADLVEYFGAPRPLMEGESF